jgi:hypothetical protein
MPSCIKFESSGIIGFDLLHLNLSLTFRQVSNLDIGDMTQDEPTAITSVQR